MVALRAAVRAAIADVWEQVPENADGFQPHVSLADSNAAGPAEPIVERLAAGPATSVDVTVTRVALIDLNRDRGAYEWTDIAAVELGGAAAS